MFYNVIIMTGYTILEIAKKVHCSASCVKQRLRRAGVKPIAYAGPTAFYDETAFQIAAIKKPEGRSRKNPQQ